MHGCNGVGVALEDCSIEHLSAAEIAGSSLDIVVEDTEDSKPKHGRR